MGEQRENSRRKKTRRGWRLSIASVVVIILILAGVIAYFVCRPFPKTQGSIRLTDLHGPVEIIRDRWGIPYIYAENADDLFFAQGYVHAQDRLAQMEILRRTGSGRLSEIVGEAALENDLLFRVLDFQGASERDVTKLDPEVRSYLEAYCRGVNTFVETHRHRLPLDLFLLRLNGAEIELEPWMPADALIIGRLISLGQSGNFQIELIRAQAIAKLGEGLVQDFTAVYPAGHPLVIPAGEDCGDNCWLDSPYRGEFGETIFSGGASGGSNAWAIAPQHSTAGSALFANDLHMGLMAPSLWYAIGLHGGGFDVTGFSIPGTPFVLLGRNPNIAWGYTMFPADTQDLYIEQLNPWNPDEYWDGSKWVPMEIRQESVHVLGQDTPLVIQVRSTKHGPIINDVAGGVQEDWSFGWQPLALRWSALDQATMLQAVLALNRASNWDEFRSALASFDFPAMNLVYADRQGNIGYQAVGRIPIRAEGDGTLPVPGWMPEYEWVGTIPFEEMPRLLNPTAGYIVSANNKIASDDYPYFLTKDWDAGYRARRAVDLILGFEQISVDYLAGMQMDVYSLPAEETLPYLDGLSSDDDRIQEALKLLSEWDRRISRDSAGAALFESFYVNLLENLFGDELGEQLSKDYLSGESYNRLVLKELLAAPESSWWDDIKTSNRQESREDILLQSLEDAVEELTEELGSRMSDWEWGEIHTATFAHPLMGQTESSLLKAVFNRGPLGVDGSTAVINSSAYWAAQSYETIYGSACRLVVDWSDLRSCRIIYGPGQTGLPFHEHYDDLIDLWQEGGYIPLWWEHSDVLEHSEGVLHLLPAEGP